MRTGWNALFDGLCARGYVRGVLDPTAPRRADDTSSVVARTHVGRRTRSPAGVIWHQGLRRSRRDDRRIANTATPINNVDRTRVIDASAFRDGRGPVRAAP